jgi:hypothetical protein
MQNSSGVMETLRAAHNITIDLGSNTWRIYNGTGHSDHPPTRVALLEATAERIRYTASFAQVRRLTRPQLAPADIARVVVGWAEETNTWHLGLLLAAQPDSDFRMRWCSLASWPSGTVHEYQTIATHAGQALAHIIDRPFHLITPEIAPPPPPVYGETQRMEATTPMDATAAPPAAPARVEAPVDPAQPDIALESPPFVFDEWALRRIPRGLLWARRRRWVWAGVLRVVGLFVLALFYLVMGIGSQISGLAAVNPTWLPWLGVVVAGLLALTALFHLGQLLLATSTVIDTTTYEVQGRRRFTGQVRWRLPFNQVAYVLVSQTPARPQGFRRGRDHTSIHQEIWLHLSDGTRFYEIAALEHVEGQSRAWDTVRSRQRIPGRRLLRLNEYDTPAHHAAYVMAEMLDTAVWLDIR